ncbi:MAG: MFS transporter [Promethearchaeota archaeon]
MIFEEKNSNSSANGNLKKTLPINADVRKLTGAKKWGYAIGALGQIFPITFFNTYAFQYYVYTIGLDASLTSVGIFLGLFVFALSSPVFGSLIDNKKPTKFGKRRPFLLLAIPGLIIFMTFAWTPPKCPIGEPFYIPTAIYFWLFSIGIDLNQGLVVSTYLSMLAEQSTDDENRVNVANLQGLFSILATVVSTFIPMILQSILEDPQNPHYTTPSGQFLTELVPIIGFGLGLIASLIFILVYFSTDENFLIETQNNIKQKNKKERSKNSMKKTFQRILLPTKDPQFRLWMGNTISYNMSLRILITIMIPFLTYVLLLEESEFIVLLSAILPFAIIGFLLWTNLIHKKGLKYAYTITLISSAILSFITIIFLIDMDKNIKFIIGIINLGLIIATLVGGYLYMNPIVSKLIDLAPEKVRKLVEKYSNSNSENMDNSTVTPRNDSTKLSGAYFGAYIFSYNIAQAVANLILGLILTGDKAKNPTIITLTLPISGIFVLIAYLFLKPINIPHFKNKDNYNNEK